MCCKLKGANARWGFEALLEKLSIRQATERIKQIVIHLNALWKTFERFFCGRLWWLRKLSSISETKLLLSNSSFLSELTAMFFLLWPDLLSLLTSHHRLIPPKWSKSLDESYWRKLAGYKQIHLSLFLLPIYRPARAQPFLTRKRSKAFNCIKKTAALELAYQTVHHASLNHFFSRIARDFSSASRSSQSFFSSLSFAARCVLPVDWRPKRQHLRSDISILCARERWNERRENNESPIKLDMKPRTNIFFSFELYQVHVCLESRRAHVAQLLIDRQFNSQQTPALVYIFSWFLAWTFRRGGKKVLAQLRQNW